MLHSQGKVLATFGVLLGLLASLVAPIAMRGANPDPFAKSRLGRYTYWALDVKNETSEGMILRGKEVEQCPPLGPEWADDRLITVTVQKDGTTDIHRQFVEKSDLEPRLKSIFAYRSECRIIHFDIHPALKWGEVIQRIDSAKGAGAIVGLWTEKLREQYGYPPREP